MFPHPWTHRRLVEARRLDLVAAAERGRPPRTRGAGARRLRRTIDALRPRPRAHVLSTHFAHRESYGIVVDLYWEHDAARDVFRVEVADLWERTRLTLRPASGREALEAFYHPFARPTAAGEPTRAAAA